MNIESINKYLFVLLLLFIASRSFADQTEFHISNPVFHVDNPTTGEPLSGGKVYFYEAGTTTPKPVYQDASATVSHATPVVLDAYGNKQIYGNGTYKVVITDSDGVTLETMDYVHISTTTTSYAESILGAADAATARTLLGLGAGAITDVGTDALQLVQLDSNKKLPSVNASQLTGFATQQIMILPRAYLAGFTMSNASGYAQAISVSAGACRDTNDATNIVKTGSFTKHIDSAWSEGNAGGLATGQTLSPTTWYNVYIISSSTTVDAMFSETAESSMSTALLQITAPGYTNYRRIGSVLVDATSEITAFHQYGDRFVWDVPKIEYTNNSLAERTDTLVDIDYVPDGVSSVAHLGYGTKWPGGTYSAFYICSSIQSIPQEFLNEWVDDYSHSTRYWSILSDVGEYYAHGNNQFQLDSTSQVRIYVEPGGSATTSQVYIVTYSYIDRRGRDD